MKTHLLSRAVFAALITAGSAAAQNDECTGAIALTLGNATAFNTGGSTTSAPAWPCAAGGNDIWYRVTAATTGTLSITTCGSSYDTALEAFSGACAGLVSLGCNDDSCGLQSNLAVPVTAGQQYYIRVGGFGAATGAGTITASQPPPLTNDECTTAIALTLNTPTAFDTTGSTTSAPAWPCAGGGNDVWYTYVATSGNRITVDTCGSGYDTALEAFSGGCAGLTSIVCNDDSCGLQSSISWVGTAGTTYQIRIGGFGAATGVGTVQVTETAPPPPLTSNCVESFYAFNNFGNVGGAIYFDLTCTQPVTLSGLFANFNIGPGNPVGMLVSTCATTYNGNEGNPAAWTQVAMDDGMASSAGVDSPTIINFAAPMMLPAGTHGIALVAVGAAHAYTNGTGANQTHVSADGVLSINAGSATNFPFATPVFTPRVWNGRFCTSGPVAPGSNYCNANANSTGQTGNLNASGSASVASNNLTLIAERLPNNAFGFFLTSATQAVVPNPGGSQGILCLGGQIGRYVGPGQIKNSGAVGSFSLLVNLTQTPTPTGFVSVMAGQTRSFQAWHRDSVGGTATSNFTNGRVITFN